MGIKLWSEHFLSSNGADRSIRDDEISTPFTRVSEVRRIFPVQRLLRDSPGLIEISLSASHCCGYAYDSSKPRSSVAFVLHNLQGAKHEQAQEFFNTGDLRVLTLKYSHQTLQVHGSYCIFYRSNRHWKLAYRAASIKSVDSERPMIKKREGKKKSR